MQRNVYVDNIDRDEMRSGFLVTSHRKKLWNVQLNLIVELDRICRKHDIKWFASMGTLLGAVRHKGFIPWDDDVDIAMLRPDYEKFKRVAPTEIDPKYFVDLWLNYVHEGDPNPEGLPAMRREQVEKYPWLPFSPFLKLRDPSTTYIKYFDVRELVQGIWVDVFPLDPVPTFDNQEQANIFWTGEELRRAVTYPTRLTEEIELGMPLITSPDRLREIISLPFRERALTYENYLADNYFESKFVEFITFYRLPKDSVIHFVPKLRTDFNELIRVPFEQIEVWAPANYDSILTTQYGDWRTPKISHSHAQVYSADVSYKEYLAQRQGDANG